MIATYKPATLFSEYYINLQTLYTTIRLFHINYENNRKGRKVDVTKYNVTCTNFIEKLLWKSNNNNNFI